MERSTITLTFGDQAENHHGMQKIGQLAQGGFTLDDLLAAQEKFVQRGVDCQIYHLNTTLPEDLQGESEPAYLLHAPGGVSVLLSDDHDQENSKLLSDLYQEQLNLSPDPKAHMYGRVVNKIARHNLCFGPTRQEPDYENKKGTIVSYAEVPRLDQVRTNLPNMFGPKGDHLVIEGNYYYDISKCGIGFHGDAERRKVIAVRLGASLPLDYQWFHYSKPVGDRMRFVMGHGDLYAMSEKAVGFDWRKKKILTLRHAAGCEKFLKTKT